MNYEKITKTLDTVLATLHLLKITREELASVADQLQDMRELPHGLQYEPLSDTPESLPIWVGWKAEEPNNVRLFLLGQEITHIVNDEVWAEAQRIAKTTNQA
jgi:hypothetical protein